MDLRKQWFCFAVHRTKGECIILNVKSIFRASTFFIVVVFVSCVLSSFDSYGVLKASALWNNVNVNSINDASIHAEKKKITEETFIDKKNSLRNENVFADGKSNNSPSIDNASFVAVEESQVIKNEPLRKAESSTSSATLPDKTVGLVHVEHKTNVNKGAVDNSRVTPPKETTTQNKKEGNMEMKTKIKDGKKDTVDKLKDVATNQILKSSDFLLDVNNFGSSTQSFNVKSIPLSSAADHDPVAMKGTNYQTNAAKKSDNKISAPVQFVESSADQKFAGASESDGFASRFAHFIMEKSVFILKAAAVLSAIAMQLTPIPTVKLISRAHSTGDLDGLPYIMLMFSAFLWLIYGILRVDAIIVLPNITGLLLGGWYVVTYHVNCNNSTFRKSLDDYYKVCCFVVIVLIVTLVIIGKTYGIYVMGLTSAFFNVISYGAPLAGLRTVIRDKSTACMPAEVSIGNFVCSSLWLAYGCVVSDLFIIVPNLLGVIVGSLQIGLLAVFPPPKYRGFAKLRGKMELFSSQKSSTSTLKDDEGSEKSWRQTNYNATVNEYQNDISVKSNVNLSSVSPVLSCAETCDTCSLNDNCCASSCSTLTQVSLESNTVSNQNMVWSNGVAPTDVLCEECESWDD